MLNFVNNNLLDALNLGHENIKLIANNIANINTPNYKRKYLDLEKAFQNKIENKILLKHTYDKHIKIQNDFIKDNIKEDTTILREDGSSVDITNEINQLYKSNLYYNTIMRFITKDINLTKTIINNNK